MGCLAHGGSSHSRLSAVVLALLSVVSVRMAAAQSSPTATPDPQVKLSLEPVFDTKAAPPTPPAAPAAPVHAAVPGPLPGAAPAPANPPGAPPSVAYTKKPSDPNSPIPTGPIVDDSRATAAALNYCRAAFHRIRQQPNKVTLAQEQEKILNNLNLDGVVDQEVIQLYSSVLDEIGQIGLADQERALSKQLYRSTVARKVTWDIISLGADVATAQVGNAVRTGASSWWDYRTSTTQHESDLMKIEKTRMTSVVQKSSQFMHTFWQLAQKKRIPDRWLIRGDDLDQLDVAMQEKNPETRIRVLKRMEPFMECYPPYWYYVGRAQQEHGDLVGASQTYQRLERIGHGHFRKDDMLATGLANQAAIDDYLGKPGSVETARRALAYSGDVWEANLMCARILERGQRVAEAEDAILRNIDVDLETSLSRTMLVTLYTQTQNDERLVKVLSDPAYVAEVPAPVLLRCVSLLGQEKTPAPVMQTVLASIDAQPYIQVGQDDVIVRAASSWQLHLASLQVSLGDRQLSNPQIVTRNGIHYLRYATHTDIAGPFSAPPSDMRITLNFQYPDKNQIQLTLQPDQPQVSQTSRTMANMVNPRLATASSASTSSLRIADIKVGEKDVALTGYRAPSRRDGLSNAPIRMETGKPVLSPEMLQEGTGS